MNDTSPVRRYRGASPDERRAERRRRLIAAAVAVYGEQGYRNATVKSVCAAAGLTERYFYESYANSEELLIACFNAVTYRVFDEIEEAARQAGRSRARRARAMLTAYFSALRSEPRGARVFLVEIRGVSRAVDAAFDAALAHIGRAVAQAVAPRQAQDDALLQAGVVGAVMHIALRWIGQGYRPGLDAVTDTALRLAMVLARAR